MRLVAFLVAVAAGSTPIQAQLRSVSDQSENHPTSARERIERGMARFNASPLWSGGSLRAGDGPGCSCSNGGLGGGTTTGSNGLRGGGV